MPPTIAFRSWCSFLAALIAELSEIAPITYVFVALAITVAGLLQGTTGLGFGLIAGPVLVLVDPGFVPGAVLMTGLSISGLATLRELPNVNRGHLIAGIGGRIPGAMLGAYLAAYLAPAWFGVAFGVMILTAVLISIISPRFKATNGTVATAGMISGVMGTLTSVGAPPMAIVMQNQSGPEMRSTISAFLFFGAIISIASLIVFGRFGWGDAVRSAILIPFCLLGFWLSGPMIKLRTFNARLRPVILTICVVMSVLLLYRSAMSLF